MNFNDLFLADGQEAEFVQHEHSSCIPTSTILVTTLGGVARIPLINDPPSTPNAQEPQDVF